MIQTLEFNAGSRDGRGKTKHFLTKNDILCNEEHTFLRLTLERFSIECLKTKTKVSTLANHKGHR